MARNLSGAAKRQTAGKTKLAGAAKSAAKNVASKIAGSGKSTTTAATTPNTSVPAVALSNNNGKVAITVPGLSDITPDKVAAILPQFNESAYQISDPLNPPDTLPQVTQAQFDRGMGIYEGSQRALKLTGAAMDTTRERFVTIGKQVKAIGSGIQTATEIEKVKGNYLDYLNQLQVTDQKQIVLDIATARAVRT